MTDSNFPLQLWDRLTPQAESTLNMMGPSCTNPNISAHKAIHGPYDWSRFPLAPPGCKAVIYKSPKACNLWGSRGTDKWYAIPLFNHYRCNHYFVSKTRAYKISGSAKLFPNTAKFHSSCGTSISKKFLKSLSHHCTCCLKMREGIIRHQK
jgi:hypothetical protein